MKGFAETVAEAPSEIVAVAVAARRKYGICDKQRARFGDCNDTARMVVQMLNKMGLQTQFQGGQFVCDPNDDLQFDHGWVLVDGQILDPTVDQFFSELDVDLYTKTPGVYFSHPEWDGEWLRPRYITP